MPQFLTTSGTSHLIEDIIIRAKTELVLITPYLRLSRILLERLTEANNRGVNTKLVYGKVDLHPGERKQLEALTNMELLFLENLHAKCYHNEATLIVSSMNLYEFSEKNNREMGIVLTRRDDEECFADALAEAHSIIAAARRVAAPATAQSKKLSDHFPPAPTPAAPIAALPAFDHNLKVRKMYELLREKAIALTGFKLESRPHHSGEGVVLSLTAQSFPKSGINFGYDGWSIRLDYQDHRAYSWTKAQKQGLLDKALQGYRCYWNQDVIQIYATSNYEYVDEQAAAEYFVQAIECAAATLLSPYR
jgi:hypothetical protein